MARNTNSRVVFPRATSKVVDKSGPFKLTEREFELQYYAYYNARFDKMKDWVKETVVKRWGTDRTCIELSSLMDHPDETVIVIGTILKHMVLQPSVLSEVSDDLTLVPQPALKRYTDTSDYLLLQDKTESVILHGNIEVDEHVTGVMLAVLGKETDNGNRFLVEEFCYPTFPPQDPLSFPTDDNYMVLVSGLGFAPTMDKELITARDNFANYVCGFIPGGDVYKSSRISRVLIAGNVIGKDARAQEKEIDLEETENEPEWARQDKCYTMKTLELVDEFLVSIAANIAVDVMPGWLDATSTILPQQPVHPCLMPKSAVLSSIRYVTNPYSADYENINLTGTSGRVVPSIQEFSKFDEPVEILEKTLFWRHLVPSAPDTVQSYPYSDQDPFVMEKCPHVYFAGNQEEFNTKFFQGELGEKVRIIAIPDFEKTRSAVLLNLHNLEVELLAFG